MGISQKCRPNHWGGKQSANSEGDCPLWNSDGGREVDFQDRLGNGIGETYSGNNAPLF
jgi:hypothetical protein